MERNSFNWGVLAFGILICIILWLMESCSSSITWNEGICSYCGGHYVFQQAIGHQYFTDYMYICDTCGRTIKTSEYYPVYNEGENNER